MNCTSPIWITKGLDRSKYPDGLEVPCGKCLNCRIQYRTMWATRLYHESDYWKDKSFITLTYDEEHCPKSISKSELQKFFKRLRKRVTPVKYFACGEYGDQSCRPHYHAILLGCGLNTDHKKAVIESWPFCDWDVPAIRRKAFGLVEPESIQYVTQYVDKKLSGELGYEVFTQHGLEIPFRLVSNGLGARFAMDNSEQLRNLGYVSIRGKKRSIPRYYLEKASFSDKERTMLRERQVEKEIEYCESITGLSYSRADSYKLLSVDDVLRIEETKRSENEQLELNKKTQLSRKLRRL